MQTAVFTGIDTVPSVTWDEVAPGEFFFQRAFLRVMEESGVENARYRYLILKENGRPSGLAVLSTFTLKLDLLAGDPWIRRLRRVAPSVLDVPIVCCGVPASFSQYHLHMDRMDGSTAAFRAVHKAMEEWASEIGAGVLLWKEWNPSQGVRAFALERGYVVLPTLPDHRVGALPATVDAWLSSLRSDYRRKFRTVAALMDCSGPRRRWGPFTLEEKAFTEEDGSGFFRGYVEVMSRTPVRLETYTEGFFRRLARSGLDVTLLRLSHLGTREHLTAMVIPGEDALSFVLVSKERAHYRNGLYTKLLQCIVLRGIEGGYAEVRLGQTSSYAKGSVGARPFRLETFIRILSPWKQRLLARFGKRLFPEVDTPRFSVFRTGKP